MKKIVIISPEIPYPIFKGNQNRISLTIEALLDLGAEVYLACLNSSQGTRSSKQVVKDVTAVYPRLASVLVRRHPRLGKRRHKFQHTVRKGITVNSNNPFMSEDVCPSNFRKACRTLINEINPDLVLVNYIKLSSCLPEEFDGMKVVDLHDVQSNILKADRENKGGMSQTEYLDHLRMEMQLIDSYDHVVSINKNETAFLNRFVRPEKVLTLPGCARPSFGGDCSPEYDLAFLGSASPFNVEGIMKFDAKVMPELKRMFPGIRVAVAGDVSTCRALDKLNPAIYNRMGRIGQLSDFYRKAKVIVSPIISGAGMKVKNIEAMSYGKAIVATDFSMDGIDVLNGESALVSSDWKTFTNDVALLLKDDRLREKIEAGVREVFQRQYSFEFKRDFYEALITRDAEKLRQIGRGGFNFSAPLRNPVAKELAQKGSPKPVRTKALIFSMDAHELIDFNLFLGRELSNIGVYSEFVRMESFGSAQFLGAGFLVHGVRGLIANTRRKALRKELSLVIDKDGQYGAIPYRGVDIADEISIYNQMFPEHFDKNSTLNIVVHGFLILDALYEIALKVKPSFLVGWNGNGPHMVCLMKILAKVMGIPIFHVERGLLPQSFVFDAQGVNFKSVFAGSFLPPISAAERENARVYIADFRKKSRSIVVKADQKVLEREPLFQRFGIEEGSGYVFFPMQIEGDSNIIINSPHYKTMQEVVLDLAEATQSVGLTLVCRPHPENTNSVEHLSELTAKMDHVYIDSSVDLHAMIKRSTATVAINSTVGLEGVLHGVPTIALGNSFYSSKGITYDCACEKHISQVLNSILQNSSSFQERHIREDRLERLVHLLIGEYLLFFDGAKGAAPNSEKLGSMLLRGGIIASRELGPPGQPKAVVRYQNMRDQALISLKNKKVVKVRNQLAPGTVQYHNGAKRIVVTDELIMVELRNKYGLNAEICSSAKDDVDILIIDEVARAKTSREVIVVMNEFFEVVDA